MKISWVVVMLAMVVGVGLLLASLPHTLRIVLGIGLITAGFWIAYKELN